jgi:hypothetical protein
MRFTHEIGGNTGGLALTAINMTCNKLAYKVPDEVFAVQHQLEHQYLTQIVSKEACPHKQ